MNFLGVLGGGVGIAFTRSSSAPVLSLGGTTPESVAGGVIFAWGLARERLNDASTPSHSVFEMYKTGPLRSPSPIRTRLASTQPVALALRRSQAFNQNHREPSPAFKHETRGAFAGTWTTGRGTWVRSPPRILTTARISPGTSITSVGSSSNSGIKQAIVISPGHGFTLPHRGFRNATNSVESEMTATTTQQCGVYGIRNITNGKLYIGSSCNIRRRFSDHKNQLRNGTHSNVHLLRAWGLYGEKNFTFSVLEECPPELRIEREIHHLKLQPKDNIYNLVLPEGVKFGGTRNGHKNTAEHRKKIGDAHRGKPMQNKGWKNTWGHKSSASRFEKYSFVIEARRENSEVRVFKSPTEAARELHCSRKSVCNILHGRAQRIVTGWTFTQIPKSEIHIANLPIRVRDVPATI